MNFLSIHFGTFVGTFGGRFAWFGAHLENLAWKEHCLRLASGQLRSGLFLELDQGCVFQNAIAAWTDAGRLVVS